MEILPWTEPCSLPLPITETASTDDRKMFGTLCTHTLCAGSRRLGLWPSTAAVTAASERRFRKLRRLPSAPSKVSSGDTRAEEGTHLEARLSETPQANRWFVRALAPTAREPRVTTLKRGECIILRALLFLSRFRSYSQTTSRVSD